MNGEIFRLFGIVILLFNALLTIVFALSIRPDLATSRQVFDGPLLLLFFGFMLLSTLIAVGLIRLHRWAALTASAIGVIWALLVATALGHQPVGALVIGLPVVFGMLLPLYVTVKNWSALVPIENLSISSSRVLRSLDPLRLE
jgi:hypothetical protein